MLEKKLKVSTMNAGHFISHKTCDENQEIDEYNDHNCDEDPRMDTVIFMVLYASGCIIR